jgi:hypothetical protein
MPNINRLIPDIYTIVGKKDGWFTDAIARELSYDISKRLQASLGEQKGVPYLRLSALGPRCPKALWHSIHTPELAESLPPWAEVKYAFGHILEALAIALAKAAGHTVTGEQDELVLDGVPGHRDCVIDGCIVDVKSCSSRAFDKLKNKTLAQDDSFGYLDQLDGYVVASASDPLVEVKDKGYLLGIDKTLGHMCLYEHRIREEHIRARIRRYQEIVSRNESPECECGTQLDGVSGNLRLDTKASYSLYKYCCFPKLRTFVYASGPRYLTRVVRKPDVPEVDRSGTLRS